MLYDHAKSEESGVFGGVREEEAASESEDYSELYEALSHLPDEIRLCVTLYYMEGYHVREIAELLDTTESTVKNRLARARMRLKRNLRQRCKEGGYSYAFRGYKSRISGDAG